jgi:hypothetical protein
MADVLVEPALHDALADAELLGERAELPELHDDADRPRERPRRRDDRAGRGGDVVAARCRDVPEGGDDGLCCCC